MHFEIETTDLTTTGEHVHSSYNDSKNHAHLGWQHVGSSPFSEYVRLLYLYDRCPILETHHITPKSRSMETGGTYIIYAVFVKPSTRER
jgi:hypothetical protein